MIEIDLPDEAIELVDVGPEAFAAADGSVLNWRGRNYVPQDATFTTPATVPQEPQEPQEPQVDAVLGFDVNDFDSTTLYGIFNDPDADDLTGVPEDLRARVFDVPLYEDDALGPVARHARVMNEDRDRLTPPRSHVIIMTWTVLKTPRRRVEGW